MSGPVLAFDPARRTGWAYVDADGWRCGVVDPGDTAAVAEAVQSAIAAGCTRAVIEKPFLGLNPATFRRLTQAATRLEVIAETHGLDVSHVAPCTWQSALGIGGKRPERKAASMAKARALGADVSGDDESDAVLMAYWAANHGQQAEIDLRGPRGGVWRSRRQPKENAQTGR